MAWPRRREEPQRRTAVTDTQDAYALTVKLDAPYEEAIEQATAALKSEGFGVLTEIDVKATLKKKIDAEFRRYVILGACNPGLAHQALQAELNIGLMLPCNVIVYEADEGSVVSIVDPMAMLSVGLNPALKTVADQARAKLENVAAALSGR
jgi:uncharacterized protein (DUF302 family)